MPEDLVWGWVRRCVGDRSSRGEDGRRAVVSCEAGQGGSGTVCSGTGFGGGDAVVLRRQKKSCSASANI